MARFRPTELMQYLEEIGAKPKKGLSQNFLIDGNILDKIIKLADLKADDVVLEIGPGPGALTEKLLETGCQVVAIEKDDTFAKALALQNHPRLQVIHSDVMDVSFSEICKPFAKKVKIVANLPYNLTTPILYKILHAHQSVQSACLMVQQEVAERFLAPSKTKLYGAVNVAINYYSKARYGFSVSRSSFYPAPRVDSAVIHLALNKPYTVADDTLFFAMVDKAFSMRRKQLASSLREFFSQEKIQQALVSINLAPTIRPEELSIQEWVLFCNAI